MLELEKQPNGTYKWNPQIGKKYFLGNLNLGRFSSERVDAIYFGVKNGKHVFVKEENEKLFAYSSDVSLSAIWYSDGEDDPSFPAFQFVFEFEVTDQKLKKTLLDKLNNFKKSQLERKL